MQTRNKKTIVIFALFILLSLQCLETVSSAGLGVAPSQIIMEDRLKGTSILKSVRLFNNGEEPVTFNLTVTGDIKDWIKIYKTTDLTDPIQNISVFGREEVFIQFTIPTDVANGFYKGTINAKTSSNVENPDVTGGTLNIIFPVNISLGVTGDQILAGQVTDIYVNDVEIGDLVVIDLGFLNTGNVIATPLIEVEIFDEGKESVDDFSYSDTDVGIDSDEIISVEWDTTGQKIGNYTANVQVSLDGSIIFYQNLSFFIFELGTLVPKGEIVNLSYSGKPSEDETLIINAEYKNTGKVITDAQFVAEVYRNDNLIETLESPENTDIIPTVGINETFNYTVYLKIRDAGDYNIRTYVALNENNRTAYKTLSFKIEGPFENILLYGIIFLILIIFIGSIIYLSKKGKLKVRKKKKKIKSKPNIKPRSVKNKKKAKTKAPKKNSFLKKLSKLRNKRIRFRLKPTSKK